MNYGKKGVRAKQKALNSKSQKWGRKLALTCVKIMLAAVVGIGTSLPELVTSIVAARKNEVDMALGNAIGSNVFNILMVLGIASAISPISIITENIIDRCVLIAFTVCVWIFAGSKKKIGRVEGFCMVALYAAYAVYIIIR